MTKYIVEDVDVNLIHQKDRNLFVNLFFPVSILQQGFIIEPCADYEAPAEDASGER